MLFVFADLEEGQRECSISRNDQSVVLYIYLDIGE